MNSYVEKHSVVFYKLIFVYLFILQVSYAAVSNSAPASRFGYYIILLVTYLNICKTI